MLGVCYYPEHWPEALWAEDARRMKAMGIALVRMGELAWSRIEPESGRFEWGWLDRAVDLMAGAGLSVVLGTPTAAPPKWLVDLHPDILPVSADGRVRGFGGRRHYSFSSQTFRRESARIVEAMARRYGAHASVVGWQTDNEYGCHDTVFSYGAEDVAAFREWLRDRYGTPERLNAAWGNVFWSMQVSRFDEVGAPAGQVAEANPAALLDWRRFSSEQIASYNRMQIEIIRAHSPGRFVTHNFMGFSSDFDHWPVGDDLDVASWDSYPLGMVELFPLGDKGRARWARTSHPDMAPLHHDLYRGIGRGRFWVMEQQPGPVNWAAWNPVPKPGMVRLWTWEALAHGAEVVSYFRWAQCPFAQEQMHSGLNLPDRTLAVGGREAEIVAGELARIGPLPPPGQAPVALVFDYETAWFLRIQPQGQDFRYHELVFRWYESVRRFGLDVDLVRPGASLAGYAAVLVPSLAAISAEALAAFTAADAIVLFGPRTGAKTQDFRIPDELPPGPLQRLLPLKVTQVASLRPGLWEPVSGELEGGVTRWREWLETELPALARFTDGTPAVVGDGKRFYLAGWPERELLVPLLRHLLGDRAALALLDLPDSVRLRRRSDLTFAFNYGDSAWTAPSGADADFLIGEAAVGPQQVACWREA